MRRGGGGDAIRGGRDARRGGGGDAIRGGRDARRGRGGSGGRELRRAGGNNAEHDTGMRVNDEQERGRHDEESPVEQSWQALLLSLFFFFFFNFKLYCMYVGPNPRKASPSLGEYIDCTSIYV